MNLDDYKKALLAGEVDRETLAGWESPDDDTVGTYHRIYPSDSAQIALNVLNYAVMEAEEAGVSELEEIHTVRISDALVDNVLGQMVFGDEYGVSEAFSDDLDDDACDLVTGRLIADGKPQDERLAAAIEAARDEMRRVLADALDDIKDRRRAIYLPAGGGEE